MSLTNSPALLRETVLNVHHWNDTLFSFTTTRNAALRFQSGQFLMIGLEIEGRPILRAYSIASPNYEEHLEFYSIKVPDGPLTSQLQHLRVGSTLLVGRKPTGTLIKDNLRPGRNLYLLCTGTGLAPFMSIVQDPDYYEAFEHIVLVHGVRYISELGYSNYLKQELPSHEYLGDLVTDQFRYFPTVTREPFTQQGRITDLLEASTIERELGLPALDAEHDRVMVCGNPEVLVDLVAILHRRGFDEGSMQHQGSYVIERAFVEK
ncbi:ferredoxin--NADP+ reductase [Undibacterium sp. GrIS 1.8]|uniref:ferredoxin--NADP reductase n=1 Tax=unclassified Undibacterium TaxID=2630295 RepID=UPI003398B387